jgi:hypothetical protein
LKYHDQRVSIFALLFFIQPLQKFGQASRTKQILVVHMNIKPKISCSFVALVLVLVAGFSSTQAAIIQGKASHLRVGLSLVYFNAGFFFF